MQKQKDIQQRIVHRLKISLGHLKKVIEMAEKHDYCIDLLHQSQAVQKALKETDMLILENHLKNCTTQAMKDGHEEKAVSEIIELLRRAK